MRSGSSVSKFARISESSAKVRVHPDVDEILFRHDAKK